MKSVKICLTRPFVSEEAPENFRKLFRYEELKEFLQYMKRISKVTSLANWDGSNAIILRHDVDLDVRAAYILSLIEKECGVVSTFFIMATCHTYNPLSLANRKMLSKMANNGFEIGLHFDPTIYGNISVNELKSKVDMEAKILESIVNQEVKSISLHNPSVNGQFPLFEGYKNAYHKDIFSDNAYMSDSCMNFRGKNPFEFVKKSKKQPIQILLHPTHYTENGGNYLDIFASFILNLTESIDKNFKVNSTYLSLIGDEMLIDLIIRRMRKRWQRK
jgi:hypothetical protein